jgi:hypothetical protein
VFSFKNLLWKWKLHSGKKRSKIKQFTALVANNMIQEADDAYSSKQ